MRIARFVLLIVGVAALGLAQDDREFFEKKVRPVLATKCYSCHTASKLGGLRLDSREAVLQGGKSGPAIIAGDPESSLLMKAVRHDDQKLKMPMAGEKLSGQEIADLAQWIKSGAQWPATAVQLTATAKGFHITDEQRAFWSFQPLKKAPAPEVTDSAWSKTAIDRFIFAKLREKDFKPVKLADKRVLIRRATFDLTGLPPTPEQVDAFIADSSPDAFAKVIEGLLSSPHYGERWGRHWLDIARYADGEGGDRRRGNLAQVFIGYGMAKDGYANTFRYRDWVIDAFNKDLPYDQFVKAQIAADLLPGDRKDLLPGLGFFGLGPWFTGDDVVFTEARANERDDKIDALAKGFLGLTVTCARCHDHKYDPISQKDYYALGGVFLSSGYSEYNLAPGDQVARYKEQLAKNKAQQEALKAFGDAATLEIAERLSARTPDYMMAVRRIVTASPTPDAAKVAAEANLDTETLARWVKYQINPDQKQHPYLKDWDKLIAAGGGADAEALKVAEDFSNFLASVIDERKVADAANEELKKNYKPEPNEARAALPGDLMQFELFQFKQSLVQKVIDTSKFYLYQELMDGDSGSINVKSVLGVYEYKNDKVLRHLSAEKKTQLETMQADLKKLSDTAPEEYPYLMTIAEDKPQNMKLNVRGNPYALGDEVPRGFPAVLGKTAGDPLPFIKGSGRLELAEAIVNHPLTARVMANRVWMHHFGRGIVASPSNFGVTGERPTHPQLLDYLASRLVESNWSIKALTREIMLSRAYQLAADYVEPNQSKDPENRYVWRASVKRLEAEAIRDSLLFVTGILDERVGGPPADLASAENKKRTVYGRIRRSPDRMLTLFDFPDPTISGDQRAVTNVPLQSLYFLNSDFVWRQADLVAKRLEGQPAEDSAKISRAYRLLYDRAPNPVEMERGLKFIDDARRNSPQGGSVWQRFAQVLLSANEFHYLN